MQIISKFHFVENGVNNYYIRIKPRDLSLTIKDILLSLANLSWLSKVAPESIKKSFKLNAEKTIKTLETKLTNLKDKSEIKRAGGEYIVSVLAKDAIVTEMSHIDVPLMELLGRKKIGNPGFDFYTEDGKPNYVIFCGEAKYENNSNAYSSSLSQIVEFIDEQKHLSDLMLIEKFTTANGQNNLVNGIFGASSAFSTISSSADTDIIDGIKRNSHFKNLLSKCNIVILIGVDLS